MIYDARKHLAKTQPDRLNRAGPLNFRGASDSRAPCLGTSLPRLLRLAGRPLFSRLCSVASRPMKGEMMATRCSQVCPPPI
eukprot:3928326-Pyramimonas_sp.AAC.1